MSEFGAEVASNIGCKVPESESCFQLYLINCMLSTTQA